jgi:hypothetical protein
MADHDSIDPRHDPIFQRGYDPAVHGDPTDSGSQTTRRSRARRESDLDLFAPPSSRRPGGGEVPGDGTSPDPSRYAPAPSSSGQPLPGRIGAPPTEDELEESPDPFGFLAPTVSPRDADDAEDTDDADDRRVAAPAPADTTAPWRNPYLLGLVIGGAVLAIAGFQMFRAALETIYVDFAQNGFIFGGSETGADEDPDPTAVLVSMQLGWSLGPLLFLIGLAAILSVVIFVAVRWRPVREAEDRSTGGAQPDERS